MRIVCSILCSFLCFSLYGQEPKTLSFNEYIDLVEKNHPMMYQSGLMGEMAESTMRMARGGFDPKFEADWDHKSFDDKNYYSLISGAIKIPTWYGIDISAGYDNNSGSFLNQNELIPNRGLWNAGISVPLGKGFIIDNRRAELKKAAIYQNVTQQEQMLLINELLFQASVGYLNWQATKAYYDIAKEGEELAALRLIATKKSFINGDKPAIDTLESFIALQSRQFDLQKASQEYENAKISLNNYLWLEGEIPLELDIKASPEIIDVNVLQSNIDSISLLQDQWLSNHPELLNYEYKLANIEIDQRLAKEELKPDIRVNYKPLIGVAQQSLFDELDINNYSFSANISYPIVQRKQRAKIQINNIKIQDTEYNMAMKNQELRVKLDIYNNNIDQSQIQYALLNETIINYERLLRAENRKFEIGESSIFLVNSRENKYLNSRYKIIETSRKLFMNQLTYLLYSARIQQAL